MAHEVIHFGEDHMKEWMELVDIELSRLKGILESDEKRFGYLLEEDDKTSAYWLEHIAKMLNKIWNIFQKKADK